MSGLPDMRGRVAARGDPVGGRPAGIAGASHAQLAGAEHELLVRCRRHGLLQRLGVAGSTRAAKFQAKYLQFAITCTFAWPMRFS